MRRLIWIFAGRTHEDTFSDVGAQLSWFIKSILFVVTFRVFFFLLIKWNCGASDFRVYCFLLFSCVFYSQFHYSRWTILSDLDKSDGWVSESLRFGFSAMCLCDSLSWDRYSRYNYGLLQNKNRFCVWADSECLFCAQTLSILKMLLPDEIS